MYLSVLCKYQHAIYKIIRTQLNNCALHISCYTTNVEHRFIQLTLLWFCLGARVVFSPSDIFSSSPQMFPFSFVSIPDWMSKTWGIFREAGGEGATLVSSGFYVKWFDLCSCFYMFCFCFFSSGVVVEPGRSEFRVPARKSVWCGILDERQPARRSCCSIHLGLSDVVDDSSVLVAFLRGPESCKTESYTYIFLKWCFCRTAISDYSADVLRLGRKEYRYESDPEW